MSSVGAAYSANPPSVPAPGPQVIFLGAAFGGLVGTNSKVSVILPLLQSPLAAFTAAGGAVQLTPGGGGTTVAEALAAEAPAFVRHPVGVALLGFLGVAVVKQVSKAILSMFLPRLLRLMPRALRLLWQPPVHPDGCVAQARGKALVVGAKEAEKDREGVENHTGVLMKTATLPYDVDFVRKFVNYGLTVYAVAEFRHIATALLQGPLLQ
jgi:hypothetical protein